jgi:hypothetical protein
MKQRVWCLLIAAIAIFFQSSNADQKQIMSICSTVRYKTTNGGWAWTASGEEKVGRLNGANGVNGVSDDDRSDAPFISFRNET